MFAELANGAPTFRRTWRGWLSGTLGIFFVLVHLYAGIYGPPDAMLLRSVHVGIALALVFLYYPLGGKKGGQAPIALAIDLLLVLGSLWTIGYYLIELDTWDYRRFDMRFTEFFSSILLTGLVLEATRRAVGPILIMIVVFFLVHSLFADHFVGAFFGPPSSFNHLAETILLGSDGVYGIPIAVMAQFVVLFILFGTLLNTTGGGTFFTRLAFALFGHRTGGPAKAAVASSAFLGSLSGSSIGNVLTTGAFTIPLMKSLGYRRAFAGGVEAAASNGGIIMPPVMGAVAFIMAEFLGRSYLEIIGAAAIPAVLYFAVIFVTVHLEAKKLGLETMARKDLPRAWPIIRKQGYLALPLVLIVVALSFGYSIVLVAVVIIFTTIILALIQRTNRLTPARLIDSLEKTAKSTAGVSAAAAAAGIIIGAIFSTGLSFQISQAAVDLAGEHIWLLLVITAIMALIMGMGMTAVAVYITLVATVIPILVKAGIPDIAAHFFAFYYGIISLITPPVALTAFAAAPLAGATPMATAVQASRLGAATFLLPILFIYSPALLLEGAWWEILLYSTTAFIGLSALAIAFTGYLFTTVPYWMRGVLLVSTILLIVPDFLYLSIGFVLVVACFAFNWQGRQAARAIENVGERAQSNGVVSRRNSIFSRLLGRFVDAQLKREGGSVDVYSDSPDVANIKDLTQNLMSDEEKWGGAREISTAGLWIAWAIIFAGALSFELMGQVVFHAAHPIIWTGILLFMSGAGLFGVVTVWRKTSTRETEQVVPANA